jgi:hypothetical protein
MFKVPNRAAEAPFSDLFGSVVAASCGQDMIVLANQPPAFQAPSPAISSSLPQVRDLIYNTTGLFQAGNRLQVLEDHCRRRMRALGVATLREYYDCLTIPSATEN